MFPYCEERTSRLQKAMWVDVGHRGNYSYLRGIR